MERLTKPGVTKLLMSAWYVCHLPSPIPHLCLDQRPEWPFLVPGALAVLPRTTCLHGSTPGLGVTWKKASPLLDDEERSPTPPFSFSSLVFPSVFKLDI